MPSNHKKYRVIAKILCQNCLHEKSHGRLNLNCTNCTFIKHHVNNLVKYTEFLDTKYPNWVWFKVYDYETESLLETFKNTYKVFVTDKTGRKVFSHTQRDIPTKRFL